MNNHYHNILIVDDIEENLFLLERVLDTPKRKFIQATNTKNALDISAKQEITFIILAITPYLV